MCTGGTWLSDMMKHCHFTSLQTKETLRVLHVIRSKFPFLRSASHVYEQTAECRGDDGGAAKCEIDIFNETSGHFAAMFVGSRIRCLLWVRETKTETSGHFCSLLFRDAAAFHSNGCSNETRSLNQDRGTCLCLWRQNWVFFGEI